MTRRAGCARWGARWVKHQNKTTPIPFSRRPTGGAWELPSRLVAERIFRIQQQQTDILGRVALQGLLDNLG